MSKTAGKGTTVSVEGTAIGAKLIVDVTPFQKTVNKDEVTAIDSAVEERAGSLPSWGDATVTGYWDKSDAATGTLQAAGEDDTPTILITFADGSTQTADCIVDFKRQQASRRGRLQWNATLSPVGDVTEADGA